MDRLPPAIIGACLRILTNGIVRGRHFAGAGQSERCFVELDHVHNLPGLIGSGSVGALRYYVEAEVVAYRHEAARVGSGDATWFTWFEADWTILRDFLREAPPER